MSEARLSGPGLAVALRLTDEELRYAAIACDLYADEFPEDIDPDDPARAAALLHAASAKLVALYTENDPVAANTHDGVCETCDGDGYTETWNVDQSDVVITLCPDCPPSRREDRCAKWIGGRQCGNFTMPDSKFCALHGKGTRDA